MRLSISWAGLVAPRLLLRKAVAIYVMFTMLLAPAWAAEQPIRILAFGDSLSAGYGLTDLADSFPVQLEKALRAKGHHVIVIPGAISGDTTTDGRTRLEWSLVVKPDATIVELGGNDALRGIDPKVTEDNMRAIVRRLRQDGMPVLVAGMMAPPNMGRDYGTRFNAVFPKIAKESDALLYPFFLEGVAAVPQLNQPDHIHPTVEGVKVIVERIMPSVEKLLAQVEARRKAAP